MADIEKTLVVKAQNGKYLIDGVEAPQTLLISGKTYEFDLSDASLNSHPLKFKLNGNSWNDGVQSTGTLGVNQVVTLTVPAMNTGSLSYYCSNHPGMGNDLSITWNNINGTDADDILTGLSGSDWFQASLGNDVIIGANGNDRLSYEDKAGIGTVNINFTNGTKGDNDQFSSMTVYKSGGETDLIESIEALKACMERRAVTRFLPMGRC